MIKLDFDFLRDAYLPRKKRRENRQLWLGVLYSHIERLNEEFKIFGDAQILEESYTAQTIALEDMLNDKFDAVKRRITIRHSENKAEYIYRESKNLNFFIYKESELPAVKYIFRELEGGFLNVDFEVVLGFDFENASFTFYKESESEVVYICRESEGCLNFVYKETENKFLTEIISLVKKYKQAGVSFAVVE